MKLSIIIPAYNEDGNLELVYNSIMKIFKDISFEIIFVNDGSTDKTKEVIEKIYKQDAEHIKAINFSRNFGKDAAIYAGLEHASGEYTCIIDADMEQDPKYLLEMLVFLEKNKNYVQVAMAIRERKSGNPLKRLGGKLFYKFINRLSDIKFQENVSDFRMFRNNMKDAILSLKETNRFSKGIFNWVGFNTKVLEYEVGKRASGKSKFNFKTSLKYAKEGIIGYSVKPLRITTYIGLLTSLAGFIYLIYIIIKTLIIGVDTPGFATIVCLILFIGGIQLLCIGILGEYLSKTFMETKKRPIYVFESKLGFDEEIL